VRTWRTQFILKYAGGRIFLYEQKQTNKKEEEKKTCKINSQISFWYMLLTQNHSLQIFIHTYSSRQGTILLVMRNYK
jgi:hypothetical protein